MKLYPALLIKSGSETENKSHTKRGHTFNQNALWLNYESFFDFLNKNGGIIKTQKESRDWFAREIQC